MIKTFIVVVHRDRQDALGLILANDIIVQYVANFLWTGNFAVLAGGQRAFGFLADNIVAQVDTLVADENSRARNQLAHLMLRFSAERAVKGALGIRAAQLRHNRPVFSARKPIFRAFIISSYRHAVFWQEH